MTAKDIESAVTGPAGKFPCRRYYVVPNVSHGWGLNYEADLIAVSPARFAAEIEIKVSLSDLRADRKKDKWHLTGLDNRINTFWYAVPEELAEWTLKNTDDRNGVLSVKKQNQAFGHPSYFRCDVKRGAWRRSRKKVTDSELINLLRLGTLRYWGTR